jgi:hypothetical protein
VSRPPWGRPSNNIMMKDLQALAFWLVLICVGGYLLFPDFFKDVYSRLQLPLEAPVQTTQQPATDVNQDLNNLPLVFEEVYGGGTQPLELSKGYWIIFVQEGQFQQLALSEESYRFVLGVIAKDQTTGTQKLILAANGQVRQLMVSEEVFTIINQLNVIGGRNRSP